MNMFGTVVITVEPNLLERVFRGKLTPELLFTGHQ